MGTQQDCARATGYTPSHVSRIVNSPEFYRRYIVAHDAAKVDAVERFVMIRSRWSADRIERMEVHQRPVP